MGGTLYAGMSAYPVLKSGTLCSGISGTLCSGISGTVWPGLYTLLPVFVLWERPCHGEWEIFPTIKGLPCIKEIREKKSCLVLRIPESKAKLHKVTQRQLIFEF